MSAFKLLLNNTVYLWLIESKNFAITGKQGHSASHVICIFKDQDFFFRAVFLSNDVLVWGWQQAPSHGRGAQPSWLSPGPCTAPGAPRAPPQAQPRTRCTAGEANPKRCRLFFISSLSFSSGWVLLPLKLRMLNPERPRHVPSPIPPGEPAGPIWCSAGPRSGF